MRRFAVPLSVFALAACTVGPDYRPPAPSALSVPDAYYGREAAAQPADLARWWERLNDPLLTRLIDEATAGNLDLAAAAARLTQARESLIQARAGRLPTIGATATGGRTVGTGNDSNSFRAGVDAAWEADLFGGIRRGIEATGADAESVYYNREALKVAIAAEVATNYVEARLAQERLALARDTLRIAEDNLQIAQWRAPAGRGSPPPSASARRRPPPRAAPPPHTPNKSTTAPSTPRPPTTPRPG